MKPFLDLLSADQAFALIGELGSLASETIGSRDALGRVCAAPIDALEDIPHFERSNMDGYALRAQDTRGASSSSSILLDVIGQIAMGHAAEQEITAKTALRTSTGAMMPAGADAVVMVEKTEDLGDGRVAIHAQAIAGQNIIRIGEDLRVGDRVFNPGHRFKGRDVGVLTGLGLSQVEVHRNPRVGIIATGDEIVEPEQELGLGQVRNVNEYLLVAVARNCGVEVTDYGVIADKDQLLSRTLARAAEENDVVFISGGSSKGAKDFTLSAIKSLDDSTLLFHGLAIAPGKPTILARAGDSVIMGLPGNPAAVAVVFALMGEPLIRVVGGESLDRILLMRPTVRAQLAADTASTQGREDYLRVRLQSNTPLPLAHPIVGKSVAISTIAWADGLLRIPVSSEGLESGSEVDVLLF